MVYLKYITLALLLAIIGCTTSTITGDCSVRYYIAGDPSACVMESGEIYTMHRNGISYQATADFRHLGPDTVWCVDDRMEWDTIYFVRN